MEAPPKHDPAVWVDEYGDDLYRYALFRVRKAETAEELVQDTFLAALKGRSSFSGRSSIKTWLFGILKHKIIDTFRKSGRERNVSSLDLDEEISDESFFNNAGHWNRLLHSWEEDPEALAQNREFREVLARCVDNLPERLARVFLMREIEALDREEICNVLDVTPTNLGVMLHRARIRMRSCLEAKWFAGEGNRTP